MPRESTTGPVKQMTDMEIRDVFGTLRLPDNPTWHVGDEALPVISYAIAGNSPPAQPADTSFSISAG